jgi:hypothetical protein
LKHDKKWWKVDKITQSEQITQLLLIVIENNWEKLNEIFIALAA